MGIQNYTVRYETTPGVYVYLQNVQSITVSFGRQAQLEQYSAGAATIVARYPTGYASPITALKPGNLIRITNPDTFVDLFFARIASVEVSYGIPYAGGVGNADTITIVCETTFARAGRMQANSYAMPAKVVDQQMSEAAAASGVPFIWDSATISNPSLAATTVTGTWGDWFNRTLMTLNGRMQEIGGQVKGLSPFSAFTSTVNFSDTTNNATNQVYDQITFTGLADNYYTQVTVAPESYTAQTVMQSGAVAPYRTLLTNTFNSSTTQATDFANYFLAVYGDSQVKISSVSAAAESQNVFALDQIGAAFNNAVGTRVSVAFRGTTYKATVEGVTMSATPNGSRYTYYLSAADYSNFLLLNDTVLGTLNYNRLGYN